MVILVDTNIIIDALANREPYADDAKRIMEKCAAREITYNFFVQILKMKKR